ncbi:MAG: hypothetical protein RJA44_2234, partial [Pseudomonadota bacterium]
HLADFDASSEEVAVMIRGLPGVLGAQTADWGLALQGHSPAELAEAEVYTLDL